MTSSRTSFRLRLPCRVMSMSNSRFASLRGVRPQISMPRPSRHRLNPGSVLHAREVLVIISTASWHATCSGVATLRGGRSSSSGFSCVSDPSEFSCALRTSEAVKRAATGLFSKSAATGFVFLFFPCSCRSDRPINRRRLSVVTTSWPGDEPPSPPPSDLNTFKPMITSTPIAIKPRKAMIHLSVASCRAMSRTSLRALFKEKWIWSRSSTILSIC
mmetsp:Transcript_21012/g.46076  ORF Transcript_21012/g.46076 Transcript_21012/m.46076 type:complete len:216 (+) Transcript_21012:185-832(+)